MTERTSVLRPEMVRYLLAVAGTFEGLLRAATSQDEACGYLDCVAMLRRLADAPSWSDIAAVTKPARVSSSREDRLRALRAEIGGFLQQPCDHDDARRGHRVDLIVDAIDRFVFADRWGASIAVRARADRGMWERDLRKMWRCQSLDRASPQTLLDRAFRYLGLTKRAVRDLWGVENKRRRKRQRQRARVQPTGELAPGSSAELGRSLRSCE